ncbi:hypothetical protein F53441_6323 [Fusarium austroafricanum]|uniref:Uncharacterized protein n=1 Tax=Fusarium austroafricanum TaxID=2364996 RepID=A0A8H4P7A4_9HYPO|nr:hypothetical protein F53441_6323 [Fusarium austroafricanum]
MPQHAVDSLRLHATSFNNECRAYGRLKELSREDLAIKAHGYLRIYLNDQIEEQFQAALQKSRPGANWTLKENMHLDDLNTPIMAIVKDWVPNHRIRGKILPREVLQRQMGHLPRMLRNLRQLHKCGIVVRDLKAQQYYEGQLGDLSLAWTVPHIFGPEHGIRPRWLFASMAAWDLKCFQDMVNHENERASRAEPPLKPQNLVAWRKDEAYERLRPRPWMVKPFLPMVNFDGYEEFYMTCYPPYDPSQFNWKAVEQRNKKASTGRVSKTKKAPARGMGRKRKAH